MAWMQFALLRSMLAGSFRVPTLEPEKLDEDVTVDILFARH